MNHQRAAANRSGRLLRSAYRALVRRLFHHFYHEFAWTYDSVAWLVSRGEWYRWTAAALPQLRGRVLEIGCGTGMMQQTLAHQYPEIVVGLDESPHMLALSQHRASYSHLPGRLVRGVAQALPCASGSFQSILVTFPSEYIAYPSTLAEVRRVLSSDGRLVLVDAATLTCPDAYAHLVALAYRVVLLRSQEPEASETHEQHYYVKLLEQHSFTVTVHPVQFPTSRVLVFVAQPVAAASERAYGTRN